MGDATIEILVRRVERLERNNRRWKSVAVLVLAFVAFALLVVGVSAKIADEVTAKRFALSDGAGSTLAVLELWDGFPALTLFGKDEKGKIERRVELLVGAFGAARLALGRGGGRAGAVVEVTDGMPPTLWLYDGGLPSVTLTGGAKPHLVFDDWRKLKEGRSSEIWRAP